MQAIRVHQFGPPEVMQLETIPDLVPSSHQVLVRLHATGVNPVDTYIRSGVYGKLPPLPYTPGTDAAGVVASIDSEIKDLAVGDRVYLGGSLSGTYAEFALAERHQVHHLAPRISFEQGASLNIPYVTAYRALFQKASAQPGETVLIHGASGGVGTAAIQWALSRGLRVIGTAGTERGRQHILAQGAHVALDHTQPNYLDALTSTPPNVILEMLANANLAKDLNILAIGGRIAIIGNRGSVEINPREIMRREAAIFGIFVTTATPQELAVAHAAIEAGLVNGTLTPEISQHLPLAQAPQAHHLILKPGAAGKIILAT